jgi:quercetin dioxygenase-like cupin family protein
MRGLGLYVAVLGIGALGFTALDAIKTPSCPGCPAADLERALAVLRLLGWATFIGFVALTTLATGLGDLMMSRSPRNPPWPPRSVYPPNGDTGAMIDAEVSEGGPPSPVPCDTPSDTSAYKEAHPSMTDKPLTLEACPAPDRILHLPLGRAVGDAQSGTLMKSDQLELIRLVIPAGKEIPPHRAPGEITVQCIEGLIAFEHGGHAVELHPGDLMHLCPQEPHALKGITDSSVLVTRLRPRADELPAKFPTP